MTLWLRSKKDSIFLLVSPQYWPDPARTQIGIAAIDDTGVEEGSLQTATIGNAGLLTRSRFDRAVVLGFSGDGGGFRTCCCSERPRSVATEDFLTMRKIREGQGRRQMWRDSLG